MARSRTQRVVVTTVRADGDEPVIRRQPDDLIVEEPLTIQLDDVVVATTMRTPGHDFELAAGYCHTEGLLAGAPVANVRYCIAGPAATTEFNPQQYNVVTVDTAGQAPAPTARLTTTSSSCGWCGIEQLDEMGTRLAPLPAGTPLDLALIAEIPDRVAPQQALFAATGAVHAAAAFAADGEVLVVREDVGRHNAVDKVIGALLLDGRLPADQLGLFVSSRASVEIVQKAWAAGFTSLVAVSAPTELAVRAARRANLALAGFVRPGGCNVYSPERL